MPTSKTIVTYSVAAIVPLIIITALLGVFLSSNDGKDEDAGYAIAQGKCKDESKKRDVIKTTVYSLSTSQSGNLNIVMCFYMYSFHLPTTRNSRSTCG